MTILVLLPKNKDQILLLIHFFIKATNSEGIKNCNLKVERE